MVLVNNIVLLLRGLLNLELLYKGKPPLVIFVVDWIFERAFFEDSSIKYFWGLFGDFLFHVWLIFWCFKLRFGVGGSYLIH